jgi:hypothetical protein
VTCWSLWLTKTEFVFQGNIINYPTTVVCRIISFMQRWKQLGKDEDQERTPLDMMQHKLKELTNQSSPSFVSLARWIGVGLVVD